MGTGCGWGLVFALAATALGCASLPPCPARGGPPWRELTSDHFALRSDLPLDEATDVLRTLEETRAGMLAGFWPGNAGPPGLTRAIALSSRSELATFTGPLFDGVHVRHPPFPPTLVLGAADSSQSTAKHELAHNLATYFLPVEPPWFAEGLATFLQTIRYDRKKGHSLLGMPDEERYRFFRFGTPMPPEKLLGRIPNDDPVALARFYATSWLLMHYLCNKRLDGLVRLQHRLGRLEPGAQAFRAEFPDLDGDGLYRTLIDYATNGQYVYTQRNVAPWTGTPRVRTMTDSEVHGVRAYLYWSLRAMNDETTDEVVTAELDEGLRSDVPALDALAVAFYARDVKLARKQTDLAAQAVRIYPGEWLAWMMSADASAQNLAASRADLLRALQLSPSEPELLIRLARMNAMEGQWDDVLSLTNRVLEAGAVHHDVWLLHLAALRETGHCEAAGHWAAALASYLSPSEATAISSALTRPCRQTAPAEPLPVP